MNNENNDLNKIKFKTLSTSKNYNKNSLTLENEILKINDIIKTKFFLPKLDQNIKKNFLDLKNCIAYLIAFVAFSEKSVSKSIFFMIVKLILKVTETY